MINREILNYKTKVSLEQGLSELIEYITIKGVRDFNYHLPIEFIPEATPKTWTEKLI